jgi:hypothetical protein
MVKELCRIASILTVHSSTFDFPVLTGSAIREAAKASATSLFSMIGSHFPCPVYKESEGYYLFSRLHRLRNYVVAHLLQRWDSVQLPLRCWPSAKPDSAEAPITAPEAAAKGKAYKKGRA